MIRKLPPRIIKKESISEVDMKKLKNREFMTDIDPNTDEDTLLKSNKTEIKLLDPDDIEFDYDGNPIEGEVTNDDVTSESKIYDSYNLYLEEIANNTTEVASIDQLKFLYDNWAMTWEGLIEEDFSEALRMCGTSDSKGYLIKGNVMNELCELTDGNAYPDDLNIFAIYPFKGLAMSYGARWMTDIIDNNADRQGYHPFEGSEIDECKNTKSKKSKVLYKSVKPADEVYESLKVLNGDRFSVFKLENSYKVIDKLTKETIFINKINEDSYDYEVKLFNRGILQGSNKCSKQYFENVYLRDIVNGLLFEESEY